jgi:phage-related protein
MKRARFLGDSRARLRAFPESVQADLGYQLYQVQCGDEPRNWKPMSSIGPGVRELRVRDSAGAFRMIYVANFADAVYVLHAFQKASQRTLPGDLAIAKTRFKEMKRSMAP